MFNKEELTVKAEALRAGDVFLAAYNGDTYLFTVEYTVAVSREIAPNNRNILMVGGHFENKDSTLYSFAFDASEAIHIWR